MVSPDIPKFITHILDAHKENVEVIECPHCNFKTIEKNSIREHIEKNHIELALLGQMAVNQEEASNNFEAFKSQQTVILNKLIDALDNIKEEMCQLRKNKIESDLKIESIEKNVKELSKVIAVTTTTDEGIQK